MRNKKRSPGEVSVVTDPIEMDTRRTRERLKTMERQHASADG